MMCPTDEMCTGYIRIYLIHLGITGLSECNRIFTTGYVHLPYTWIYLVTTRNIWKLWNISGKYCIYLEIIGYIWNLLDISGNYWIYPEITGDIWKLLDSS